MFKIVEVPHERGDAVFFGHAKVGEHFTFNGNVYKKRSSRTADLLNYSGNRWFYFSSADRVIIA